MRETLECALFTSSVCISNAARAQSECVVEVVKAGVASFPPRALLTLLASQQRKKLHFRMPESQMSNIDDGYLAIKLIFIHKCLGSVSIRF